MCICGQCRRLCDKLILGYIRGRRRSSGALYILISATLDLSSAALNLAVSLLFSQTLCKHNIKSLEMLLCYNDTSFLLKTSNCSQAFEGCSYWFLSLINYLETCLFLVFLKPHCNAVVFQIGFKPTFSRYYPSSAPAGI